MGLLKEGSRGALLQFNTLRNRFAHESHTKISQKDAQDLMNGMGDRIRTTFQLQGKTYPTPAECIRELTTIMFTELEHTLEHLRDTKLYERAVAEEVHEILERARASSWGPPKPNNRIQSRFEKLKKEQVKRSKQSESSVQ